MASFLILPPRELLEHAINESLTRILPGLPIPIGLWERIVDEMTATEAGCPTFVLHREELFGDGVTDSLIEGYGAEPGDSVVEIDTPRSRGNARTCQWTIPAIPAMIAAR